MLLLATLFVSCGSREDPLAYKQRDAVAKVKGSMNGVEIYAEIVMQGEDLQVTYLSPESLAGVRVVLEQGEGRAYLEHIGVAVSRETAEKMLLPAKVWMEPRMEALTRRQKQPGRGEELVFGNLTLLLGENGQPTGIKSEKIALSVEEWRFLEE